ncbi:unnamed protein product [Diatraea saccharalis]|uniref:Uncharacterized protein n=1 Tax=Diatraea saccharalis TaxID=40085 RepID=A0A9N9R8U4_9NEOP|nr:unnamed protein product [Diatraea saccharalis]
MLLIKYKNYRNIKTIIDINVHIKLNNTDSNSSTYLDLLAIRVHGTPGHIPTHDKTCLDHIILKTRHKAHCYVAETSVTDHDTLILIFAQNVFSKTLPAQIIKKISKLDLSTIYIL